jgi:hypothetical protein
MVTKVQELTIHLREYSASLKSAIEFSRRFMKKNPHYWNFRTIFQLKLIRYVHKNTGRPNYSAIADLLNAGLTAVGVDDFVEPGTLRKLHVRNPVSRAKKV